MKKGLFYSLIILAGLISACTGSDDLKVPGEPLMKKMAPALTLQYDSSILVLEDFFPAGTRFDSIVADPALTISWSADSTFLALQPDNKALPRLSVLRFWKGGFSYDMMVRKSPEIWVHYKFNPGKKNYRNVQLAGQMNDWNPRACWLVKTDSLWETNLRLYPGNYQYRLVIDGQWGLDPGNQESVPNGSGGYNSLLRAGNPDDPGLPFLHTKSTEKKDILIGGVTGETEIFAFWNNYQLPGNFLQTDSAGLHITIPAAAGSEEKSFIRVWGFNKKGLSNDLLIPLANGKVIRSTSDLNRHDLRSMIIYFLMVDRFYNGDTTNDSPVADPEIDPRVNYQGGDLKGVIFQLDDEYFNSLGVNTIWISPITQNPLSGYNEYPPPHRKFSGYHGYWPITLTTIDTRFGSPSELKNLVRLAHRKDINIILDYVAHHVHQDYPLLKQHPDWITAVDLPDGRKNLRLWDEQRLTTWFDIFLPTWDLTKPEVYELVSDSAAWWIGEYEIDGFRHDAAKHVPEIFWRTLTKKIDSIVPPGNGTFYQIGETFGSRQLIGSYINPGMLDAQFDFNLYWDVKNTFSSPAGSMKDLQTALAQSLSFFGYHNLMGNITGNQDMTRFITLASGALKPGEDEREAAWREIVLKDTLGYYRLASLMAFNMTIPGIPVIYYGDEFGLPGANDPDNRRMMKFDSLTPLEKKTFETTKKLVNLRKSNMPMLYGDLEMLGSNDKTMTYLRNYFGEWALVAFNKDTRERTVKVELPEQCDTAGMRANFGHSFTLKGRMIELTLPSTSFELITKR